MSLYSVVLLVTIVYTCTHGTNKGKEKESEMLKKRREVHLLRDIIVKLQMYAHIVITQGSPQSLTRAGAPLWCSSTSFEVVILNLHYHTG